MSEQQFENVCADYKKMHIFPTKHMQCFTSHAGGGEMNKVALDKAILAYCKATGLNPDHQHVIRDAIRKAVLAYMKEIKK
jgi:hypothetical protein